MNSKLRAAVIGGLVMGVLSAVTLVPQVPFVRFLCCIWAILGGVVAAYLYIKKSPAPARIGDGVVLGLLSGVVGAAISLIAFLLISFYVSDRTPAEEELASHGVRLSYASVIWMIGVLTVILQITQSLVGGIIGVALFESRRGDGGSGSAPPPPPPYYGGTPDPTYAPPPPPPPGGYGPNPQ